MGKKKNRPRFTETLDIDIQYSTTSVTDTTQPSAITTNISQEKLLELQRIKQDLPSAPQAVQLEEEIARISDSGPFRLMLNNVSYQAQRQDITNFFKPLELKDVRIDEHGNNRGFCIVEFFTKVDLGKALAKNNDYLLNRRVAMRIADQTDGSGRTYGGREDTRSRRSNFGGYDGFGSHRDDNAGQSSGWSRGAVVRNTQPSQPSFRSTRPVDEVKPSEEPTQRPVINIKPRTKPRDEEDEAAKSARYAKIFGAAKPVDIAAREREIEEKPTSGDVKIEKPSGPKNQPASNQSQVPTNRPAQSAWSKPFVRPQN